MIKEDLLHYLWNLKKFDLKNLTTTMGSALEILDFGYQNTNAGPDFHNARIRIDDVLWAGNIEIHVQSSDWNQHKHSEDRAYDNVILHVVLEEDLPIYDISGNRIPCLELKKRINREDIMRYHLFQHRSAWVICDPHFETVSSIAKIQAIEKGAIERLEHKSAYIKSILAGNQHNWESGFLTILFRYFGTSVNSDAFEMLAKSIPPKLIQKEKNDLLQVEALLFGVAGMLQPDQNDAYMSHLWNRYRFLSHKYSLRSLSPSIWKFLRMRPAAFPTIRLALLASLLFQHNSFFDEIRDHSSLDQLRHIFDAKASDYWSEHYVFGKKTKSIEKRISDGFKDLLFINVLAPFYYCYGSEKDDMKFRSRAITLLESIAFEKNNITRQWVKLGMPGITAFDSQGLIELKKSFCDEKQCLKCPVGYEIMNS